MLGPEHRYLELSKLERDETRETRSLVKIGAHIRMHGMRVLAFSGQNSGAAIGPCRGTSRPISRGLLVEKRSPTGFTRNADRFGTWLGAIFRKYENSILACRKHFARFSVDPINIDATLILITEEAARMNNSAALFRDNRVSRRGDV